MFIDVQIRTQDPTILKKLGLPNFDAFATTSLEDAPSDSNTAKFQWMNKDQCDSAGIVIKDYDTLTSVLDSRYASFIQEQSEDQRIQQLCSFLTDAGIDVESWKRRSSDKLQLIHSLDKELMAGKCYITKTGHGVPQRCVNVVAVRLLSPNRKLMLVDKMRTHITTGVEDRAPQLPGSKRVHQENLISAAKRILLDQLQLIEEYVDIGSNVRTWEFFEYTEKSNRYNGLLTQYQKFFIDVTLKDNCQILQKFGLERRGTAE